MVADGDFVAAIDHASEREAQRGRILDRTKPHCLGDCLRALCFCCRRGDGTVHPHSDLARNPLYKLRFLQYDHHLWARERLEIARMEHSMTADTSVVRGKRIVAPPPPPPKAAFGPGDVGKSLRISGDTVEVDGAPRSRRDRGEMTDPTSTWRRRPARGPLEGRGAPADVWGDDRAGPVSQCYATPTAGRRLAGSRPSPGEGWSC